MEVPRESRRGEGSRRRGRGTRGCGSSATVLGSLSVSSQAHGGARRVGPARWKRYSRLPHLGVAWGCSRDGAGAGVSSPRSLVPASTRAPISGAGSPAGMWAPAAPGSCPPPFPRAELSLRSLTEDGAKARAVRREDSGQTIWNEGKCSGCLCPQTPRSTAGKENGHGPSLRFQVPKFPGPSITSNPLNHPLGC